MPSATTPPTTNTPPAGNTGTPPTTSSSSASMSGLSQACMASTLSSSDALLRADINRRLLESGEYEKLISHLTHLLRESGWRESTLQKCNRVLRDSDAKVTNYSALYGAVEREAVDGVDMGVRMEVVKKIKEVLEGLVEV